MQLICYLLLMFAVSGYTHNVLDLSLDLVVAFDSSRSITITQWSKQIDVAKDLLNHLKISNKQTHVGLLEFSDHTHQMVKLIQGLDKNIIESQLEALRDGYEGGGHTFTDSALAEAANLFKQSPLSRKAPPVLLMLTDGKITGFGADNDTKCVRDLVAELKTMGVTIFCITFGSRLDMEGLHYIVGAHNNENIFSSEHFNASEFVIELQKVFKQNKEIEAAATTDDAGIGSICNITFLRVGCFFDHQLSPRPLPELILTDRDPDDPHYSGNKSIDWENWDAYHKDLVCRCAKRAKETKNILFATQFYGECYGSKHAFGYAKDGPALSENGCITKDKKPCILNKDRNKVCVGRQFHNYVYLLF